MSDKTNNRIYRTKMKSPKEKKPTQQQLLFEMVEGLNKQLNTLSVQVGTLQETVCIDRIRLIRLQESRRTATECAATFALPKPAPLKWHEIGTFQLHWNIGADPILFSDLRPGEHLKICGFGTDTLYIDWRGHYLGEVPMKFADAVRGQHKSGAKFWVVMRSSRQITIKAGYPQEGGEV